MTLKLHPKVLAEIQQHAQELYPVEACGLLVDGAYIRCENVAAPLESHREDLGYDCPCCMCSFEIAPEEYLSHPNIEAVIHSHPGGPFFPSERDMQGQLDTDVPWGILMVDEDRASHVEFWGDQLPIKPLIGREFVHGITDCYSLIRDVFRLGKDALKEQGVTDEWPMDPVFMADVPRSDAWWEHEDRDLYSELFESRGFHKIAASEVLPGDVFLGSVKSKKLNHGGVYIGNDLIIHHLPTKLSVRSPAGLWARAAKLWIRHKDHPNA